MYSEYYSEQKQFHRLIVDYLNVNMASKGKKRGKAIIDDKLVEKENVPIRRTGRERKKIDYCEESPVPDKKSSEKSKDSSKLEKQALQNSKKNKTQKQSEDSGTVKPRGKLKGNKNNKTADSVDLNEQKDLQDEGTQKPDKRSKQSAKEEKKKKEKKIDKVVESEVESKKGGEPEMDLNCQPTQSTTKKKPDKKQPKNKKKKYKTKCLEEDEIKPKEPIKSNKEVPEEEAGIDDVNDSVVLDCTLNGTREESVVLTKSKRKEKSRANNTYTLETENQETPVSSTKSRRTQENVSTSPLIRNSRRTPGKQANTPSSPVVRISRLAPENISRLQTTPSSSPTVETGRRPENVGDTQATPSNAPVQNARRTPGKFDTSSPLVQKSGQTPVNVDQAQTTPSSQVIGSTRQTPGTDSRLQETPSSASRVSQVLGCIRKESLSRSNTPRSGHCDCADRMTQVYEILELVTDQLTDLKTEMESVKSTNDGLQVEVESSRNETTKLREEVNNLKNIGQTQIRDIEERQRKSPVKSHVNQNEVNLLWQQCDVQKKTIRSLYSELDTTKQQFNERFEKYKQAMVFILCKTKPDIKHSDISTLRNLLNKTEKSLDLTLDEICATMEKGMPGKTPGKTNKTVPVVMVTNTDSSNGRDTAQDKMSEKKDDRRNGNILSCNHDSNTPSKENPFQARPKIKRTPVSEKQGNK